MPSSKRAAIVRIQPGGTTQSASVVRMTSPRASPMAFSIARFLCARSRLAFSGICTSRSRGGSGSSSKPAATGAFTLVIVQRTTSAVPSSERSSATTTSKRSSG